MKDKKKIKEKFDNIINSIINNFYQSDNIFNSLSKNFRLNFKIKELNKYKKFKTVIIIGMGGSILATEAIYQFLKKKIKKEFLFLDDINEEDLFKIKEKNRQNKTLFIIISKSGNTVETLCNIQALKIIKKESKNIIIISEKKQNPLYLLAKKMNLFHIEHRSYIGGRYSVLSEVGMVPAYLMGINFIKLRKKISNHFNNKNKIYLKDNSLKLATILEEKKFKTLVLLNYVPKLEKFLFWYQQLIAESLGKAGKGLLPVISPAPKDHHSLLQLYLDGPKDKLFYVFSTRDEKKIKLNSNSLNKKFNYLNNKSLGQIKNAQKDAFLKSLKKRGIPYKEFEVKDFSDQTLGELFSYFILETAIVGKLTNINPFNQPAVEEVKINTKNILS